MLSAIAQPGGICPYCLGNDFDSTATTSKHETMDIMKCNGCTRWSARCLNRTLQFPLQDPTDSGASFAVNARYDE